jgi:hypothetical protein
VTAYKGVAVVINRLLHKHLAVVDQKSTDTVRKDVIICFEKYVCHLSVPLAFLFPRKPILIKYGRVWLDHNRITRKTLALSAEIQLLFFHAITGEAISRSMFFLATTATAFYVCRASTAVKAAFAE